MGSGSEIRAPFERCGYREARGPWAPLVCGREEGHHGEHVDFRRSVSIGFGPNNTRHGVALPGPLSVLGKEQQ